ncbi:UNVERIFIED_CONTAM: hypothetical protein HDU68_012896, partial [Siphonaria sp. JEL0065]
NICLASVATFMASALYHEYIILMFMPGQPHGLNACFFLLNGFLCLVQIKLQKVTGFGGAKGTWGKGVFWGCIGWVAMWTILVVTSPLFAGTYARSGLLMTIPIPEVVLDFIMSVI